VTHPGDSIQFVKGIGPRRAKELAERGIETIDDLLHYLPFRYEDRGALTPLRELREGETVTVWGRVIHTATTEIYTAVIDDGTGTVRAVFFNRAYLEGTLAHGKEAIFHGRITRDRVSGGIQLDNPDFELGGKPESGSGGGPVPVHVKLPGFTPRKLRMLLQDLLDGLPEELPDTLPPGVRERRGLIDERRALREVQFPPDGASVEEFNRCASSAHQRLAYDELFGMQLAFLLRRRALGLRPDRHRYETSKAIGDKLRALLPWRLTAGQRQAFREIVDDLKRPVPMARLLQGDVGSGKTIVSLLAMLLAAENGFQAALMAPTEILAEQHARTFAEVLGGARQVGLLTGRLTPAERRPLLKALATGELRILVGTHALIQDAVEFDDLALAVIDEQHRFGVEQRARLAEKGDHPDVLVMTATPIPRTLALSIPGDLEVSTIPDRPPGRRPVRTVVRDEGSRERVLDFLESEAAAGRQGFIVHPLIEESEEADWKAAEAGAEELRAAKPRLRVGLVHGRMKSEEKDTVMRSFAAAELDVLVATTVIEVGIDVPNASVMLIENAERFGLAQLHQLRGRVGRGAHDSWCILMAGRRPTPEGRRRLDLLVETDDGFRLAEADLEMRGAGQFFGPRQAGLRDLRIADPVRDADLLLAAREDALSFLESLPDAELRQDPIVKAVRARWEPAVERSAAG
jgi:ATP-dependent DNA helicase RecG